MSQAQPAAPQLTQPSISPQLQAGVTETVDNMGASPAPESKESIEFVPLFLLQWNLFMLFVQIVFHGWIIYDVKRNMIDNCIKL